MRNPRKSQIMGAGHLLVCFSLLSMAGCSFLNASGNLRARHTGELSRQGAPRAGWFRALDARCGVSALTPTGKTFFTRRPYLQDVTDSSASVVFASTAAATVILRDTAGHELQRVVASVDQSSKPTQGQQRFARLTGLRAGDIYCYEIRNADTTLLTPTGIRAAPVRAVAAQVRFVAIGDPGKGTLDQLELAAQLHNFASDFLLIAGDVAYENGTTAQLEKYVFSIYERYMRQVPFYPAAGNHDHETRDAAPLREAFMLPNNAGSGRFGGGERWYSFDRGAVHIVVLDSALINTRRGKAQRSWLEADLDKNSTADWTVVVLHKPPFSSGYHGSNMVVRRAWVPLFERFGVDLVIAGHEHNYERIAPINGVTYIVTGGGGRGTRKVGRASFTAFSARVAHLVYVDIHDDVLDIHAVDATGREFDSVTIEQKKPRLPRPGWTTGIVGGRPEKPGTSIGRAGARALAFLPRIALWTLLAPIRLALWGYEASGASLYLRQLLSGNGPISAEMILHKDIGFSPNIGARLLYRGLIDERDRVAAEATFRGEAQHTYAAEYDSGALLGDSLDVHVRGDLAQLRRSYFFGIGNGGRGAIVPGQPTRAASSDNAFQTRFGQRIRRATLDATYRPRHGLALSFATAYTERDFQPALGADADIADVFEPATLTGYAEGLSNLYLEAAGTLDFRKRGSRYVSEAVPATGSRVLGFVGYAHGFSSDPSRYLRYGIDLLHYIDIFGGDRLLIVRGYWEGVTGGLDEVPFVDLPSLGGSQLLRGFRRDRLRDRLVGTVDLEYQYPVDRLAQAFIFGTAGSVWRNVAAATNLGAFTTDALHWAGGAGLELHTFRTFLLRTQVAYNSDGEVVFNLSINPRARLRGRVTRK